ncbi:MAG: DUF1232 domain-containing protein [Planctomycetaceae bacterium]|jgi:uncharacterized membrane protein YkvA (DUF1232 family)|nr:DUF1232 domain-containing protein [Planctomycetaceae bacterium]
MSKREEDEFERRRNNVKETDINDVLEKEQQILNKSHGPLAKLINEIRTLFSLLKDYRNGTYREVSWTAIAGIVASLLYVFSPIDLIPDAIPFFGLVDDAAVLSICLKSISGILIKYQAFKNLMSDVRQVTDKVFDDCMSKLLLQVEEWFNMRIKDWRRNFYYTLCLDAVFIAVAGLPQFMPMTIGILLLWCAVVSRSSWSGICFYYCVRDFYPNRVIACRFVSGFLRELWKSRSLSTAIKQTVSQAFCYVYYEKTSNLTQNIHSFTSFINATPTVKEMSEKAAERSCPLLKKYVKMMLLLGLLFILFYGILIAIVRSYIVYYAVKMSLIQLILYPFTLLY